MNEAGSESDAPVLHNGLVPLIGGFRRGQLGPLSSNLMIIQPLVCNRLIIIIFIIYSFFVESTGI